ncbi:MAG: hypothetical protein OEY01_03570 [Desulfobulbaceae bacterium]|nr:hypothetical protein [Desulfobulbaceae bacterium]
MFFISQVTPTDQPFIASVPIDRLFLKKIQKLVESVDYEEHFSIKVFYPYPVRVKDVAWPSRWWEKVFGNEDLSICQKKDIGGAGLVKNFGCWVEVSKDGALAFHIHLDKDSPNITTDHFIYF